MDDCMNYVYEVMSNDITSSIDELIKEAIKRYNKCEKVHMLNIIGCRIEKQHGGIRLYCDDNLLLEIFSVDSYIDNKGTSYNLTSNINYIHHYGEEIHDERN